MVAQLEEAAGQKANRTLAMVYANQGRNLERALALAAADLELRHDIYTWDAFSWVQFKRGRMEQAVEASREALKTGAREPLLFYHAGSDRGRVGRCRRRAEDDRGRAGAESAVRPGAGG